jgi:hypothetical protein
MNYEEIREEVITLALMLDDEFGQDTDTVDYIATELMLDKHKVKTLLTPEMFSE